MKSVKRLFQKKLRTELSERLAALDVESRSSSNPEILEQAEKIMSEVNIPKLERKVRKKL